MNTFFAEHIEENRITAFYPVPTSCMLSVSLNTHSFPPHGNLNTGDYCRCSTILADMARMPTPLQIFSECMHKYGEMVQEKPFLSLDYYDTAGAC